MKEAEIIIYNPNPIVNLFIRISLTMELELIS